MKRIFFLTGAILWLTACNADRAGSGGNPAQDSVAPYSSGKGYTNDHGTGGPGGTTDPMNGAGPQQLNNGGSTATDSLRTLPNTDTAANRRTEPMQSAGSGANGQKSGESNQRH